MTFAGAHLRTPTVILSQAIENILNPAVSFFRRKICINDITLVALSIFRINAPETGFCTQEHCDSFLRLFLRIIIKVICKDKNKNIHEARMHALERKKRKLNIPL
jgi:hypothetical protein